MHSSKASEKAKYQRKKITLTVDKPLVRLISWSDPRKLGFVSVDAHIKLLSVCPPSSLLAQNILSSQFRGCYGIYFTNLVLKHVYSDQNYRESYKYLLDTSHVANMTCDGNQIFSLSVFDRGHSNSLILRLLEEFVNAEDQVAELIQHSRTCGAELYFEKSQAAAEIISHIIFASSESDLSLWLKHRDWILQGITAPFDEITFKRGINIEEIFRKFSAPHDYMDSWKTAGIYLDKYASKDYHLNVISDLALNLSCSVEDIDHMKWAYINSIRSRFRTCRGYYSLVPNLC